MGFIAFLTCWRDGKEATFDLSVLEEVFRGHILQREPSSITVKFPDGEEARLDWDRSDRIHTLTIARPGGAELFEKLVVLARWTGSGVYWVGDGRCLAVPCEGVLNHLPPDMVHALGPPIVVASGTALLQAIEES